MSTSDKSSRQGTLKLYVDYRPATAREKISVKLEFERIRKDVGPLTNNYILSALPAVAYLLASGDFKVPRPHTVLVTETSEEILSDKVRALLERRYLKGRDIFAVWYLRSMLHTGVDKVMMERKLAMYAWPFKAARSSVFFTNPTREEERELKEASEQDLSRFLPPEALAVHQAEEFASFLNALKSLFTELNEMGVSLT